MADRTFAAPGPIAAVILLGLILRVYVVWRHNQWQPNSTAWLVGDEPGYNNMALEFLQGYGFTWPGRVPLYPTLLAGFHWLTLSSYHAIRYLQCGLSAVVIVLTYGLGRRAFGATAGWLAALLAALSFVLIHQPLHLLSEVLFTPVLLMVSIALWDAMAKPMAGRFLWAGVWIGISDLVRPTLLFFPVLLLVPLAIAFGRRRALTYGGICCLGAGLVITPWIARNYLRYHAIFPLATSNAILWQGSPEYYHLIRDQGYTYMRIWTEVLYGPGWQAHDPTSVSGDRYWTHRALRSIASEPGTYLKYAGEKLATYWVGDPNADWSDARVFDYAALRRAGFKPFPAIMVMIARALPIVALGAILLLRRRWRALLPIYALLGYTTLLHAATHAEARLSEPFQPLLLVLIAGALIARPRDQSRSELSGYASSVPAAAATAGSA